jgi:hypothetical protein
VIALTLGAKRVFRAVGRDALPEAEALRLVLDGRNIGGRRYWGQHQRRRAQGHRQSRDLRGGAGSVGLNRGS